MPLGFVFTLFPGGLGPGGVQGVIVICQHEVAGGPSPNRKGPAPNAFFQRKRSALQTEQIDLGSSEDAAASAKAALPSHVRAAGGLEGRFEGQGPRFQGLGSWGWG